MTILAYTLQKAARIAVTIAACGFPVSLLGGERADETDEFFAELASVNSASPIEGAGSHGTTGFTLGVGVNAPSIDGENAHVQRQTTDKYIQPSGDRLYLTKLYFTKGLFSPVDVGINFGTAQGSVVQQVGGYLQWTIFEAFRMPALALRATIARLSGLQDTSFSSAGATAVASWGFLGILTAYGSYGMNWNEAETRALAGESGDGAIEKSSFTTHPVTVGLQANIVPPFVTIAAETLGDRTGRHYAAKISVGM